MVAIVCLLWDLWADEHVPDSRIIKAGGSRGAATTRHGQCCPNSPYRDYAEEVGGEPPRTVDWCDPVWVRFQRKREERLLEYASYLTDTIKAIDPDVSVERGQTAPPGCAAGSPSATRPAR